LVITPETAEITDILQQHGKLLIQISKEQNYLRGALDQMNERFSSLENRVNTVEERINTVESRLSKDIRDVESRLSKDIQEVESRLSKEIRENFKWMIGLMLPVWFGILVAIVVQLLKA
jgi:predicted  nucleic acid-binding Zn-ribbon protein